MSLILTITLAVIGGISQALIWEPFNQADAAWFAWVPLIIIIRLATPRRAALGGFLTTLIASSISLFWLKSLGNFDVPLLLPYISVLGLSLIMSSYTLVFAYASATLLRYAPPPSTKRTLLLTIVVPLFFVGAEYAKCTYFTGFAWNPAGLAFSPYLPLMQGAAYLGVYAPATLVILMNSAIAAIVLRIIQAIRRTLPLDKRQKRALILESTIPPFIVMGAFLWGGSEITSLVKQSHTHKLRKIIAFDTDYPAQATPPVSPAAIHKEYQERLEICNFLKPDLVVFPESALPFLLPSEWATYYITPLLKAVNAPILFGATYSPEPDVYNNASILTQLDHADQVYAKRHLVPFGEYVPFDKVWPALQAFVPTGVSCTPGTGLPILTATLADKSPLKIAPIICYESTQSYIARNAAKAGAQLLANQNNEAWYAPSAEAKQHQRHTLLRAIETRLPIVRASNQGENAAFLPTGHQIDHTSPFYLPIATTPKLTLYTRFGDWLYAIPANIILVLFTLFCLIKRAPHDTDTLS